MVKVRGVKRVKARGKLYFYHRKTGQRIAAPHGTPAFVSEVARLDAMHEDSRAPDGTYLALVERYKRSDGWRDLADVTRRDYERVFNYMSAAALSDPFAMTGTKAAGIRDTAARRHGARFGKYVVQVNHMLFNFGREYGLTPAENPWRVKFPARPKRKARANPPWEPAEVAVALLSAPLGLARGLILAAMGFRSNDIVEVEWSHLKDGVISYQNSKTGFEAVATVPAALSAFFEGERPSPFIATNAHGRRWKTANTFTKARRELVEDLAKAGKCRPGLTTHGLKHTLGRAMEEAAADQRTLQAGLQHKSPQMALHYSRRADTRRRSGAVAEALNAWLSAAILENAPPQDGKQDCD